ncbi:ABC transporter permease [Streptomyces sp. NPDC059917]|uniref:ABC transporter permease n=1 Tax=Streptomyces sp. NPDC059917 TaxID=3347002 RepID=UPI00365A5800
MKHPGCLAVLVSAVVLLGVLGWGAKSMLDSSFDGPDNHVAATDSRVCPQTEGNNVSLADATEHFGLQVPAAATSLVFTATAGGLQGEGRLSLRFTTTPADLATFLTASHFEPSGANTAVLASDWSAYSSGAAVQSARGPCGLTPPGNPTMLYSQDGPGYVRKTSPRCLAVDHTDPAHPVVWVSGADV